MKYSGRAVLSIIHEYFGSGGESFGIYWFLLFSGIVFLVILYFVLGKGQSNTDPTKNIPESEMDLINQICAQKGLNEFDRDFLLMQAIAIYVKPIKVLLDFETFCRAEKALESRIINSGKDPEKDPHLAHMDKLRHELFL